MNLTDHFHLEVTTVSDQARDLYCNGVDQLLCFQANALDTIEQSIACDPGFALAHIARARLLQMRAQVTDAKQAATRARELAAGATDREKQHIEIIALLIEASPEKSLTLLLKHSAHWPQDALPMSIALGAIGLFAFSGRPDSRQRERAFLESVAGHWPAHWWFDTYYGWVLVETGDHAAGNKLLDRALAANPKNGQAVHARAHGYYESGEIPAGISFLEEQTQQLDAENRLMPHLRWHQALMNLQAGDTSAAKAIYEEAIAPGVSKAIPLLQLMDVASFAWRCHLYGQPLDKAQLQQVSTQANECLPAAGPAFFNWHKAMALASAGDKQGLTKLSSEIKDLVAAGKQPPGEVLRWICLGMSAAASGRWSEAIEYLEKANEQLGAIGGSSAQQDAITDTLVAASLAANQANRAADLVQKRTTTRASHLNADWMQRISAH